MYLKEYFMQRDNTFYNNYLFYLYLFIYILINYILLSHSFVKLFLLSRMRHATLLQLPPYTGYNCKSFVKRYQILF